MKTDQIIQGDCMEVMSEFPRDSIDLVVTSSPYWGLRDYGEEAVRVWGGDPECEHKWLERGSSFNKQGGEGKQSTNLGTLRGDDEKSSFCSKCGAWRGQLGLEPHPRLFIDHLVEVCRGIKRVLKPTGSLWLNLGDTYCGSGKGRGSGDWTKTSKNLYSDPDATHPKTIKLDKTNWLQPKQLLGIPERVMIGLQDDGWILRNKVVWYKPNHMPDSAKDRLTGAHEMVFLFVKERKYYFDLDAIRVPHKTTMSTVRRPTKKFKSLDNPRAYGSPRARIIEGREVSFQHPRGKNPGDVWVIPTKPFPGAHFSTFPPKLIEPIIKAGCPRQICPKCGKPRTRIIEKGRLVRAGKGNISYGYKGGSKHQKIKEPRVDSWSHNFVRDGLIPGMTREVKTVGWSDCGCGEEWEPGIVLDPFVGSGTTCAVAKRLGRRWLGIDIVPEYVEMARKRVGGTSKSLRRVFK